MIQYFTIEKSKMSIFESLGNILSCDLWPLKSTNIAGRSLHFSAVQYMKFWFIFWILLSTLMFMKSHEISRFSTIKTESNVHGIVWYAKSRQNAFIKVRIRSLLLYVEDPYFVRAAHSLIQQHLLSKIYCLYAIHVQLL